MNWDNYDLLVRKLVSIGKIQGIRQLYVHYERLCESQDLRKAAAKQHGIESWHILTAYDEAT